MSAFGQNQFESNVLTTSVDYVFHWARKPALWPLTFGLPCCAIALIASSTSGFDIARFGAEVFRPSPRQWDLMIVAGTVTWKDGAVRETHRGSDAGPEVVYRHGRVRQRRKALQY